MTHGAFPVSLQESCDANILEAQQESAPRPESLPDLEHPGPPHLMHPSGQQAISLALLRPETPPGHVWDSAGEGRGGNVHAIHVKSVQSVHMV